MSDEIRMLAVESILSYLLAEANKCQTPHGGAILLDVRRRIMGRESCYESNPPLWQVADGFANRLDSPTVSGTIEPSHSP